jgi:hypothetical protein
MADDALWPVNVVVLLNLEAKKPSDMPAVADKPWLVDAKFNLRKHFGCRVV